MPAVYTHYYFTDDLLDKSVLHRQIRLLGSQGPDVFFFYGRSLKKREHKKERSFFGTYIHRINPNAVYKLMIDYALLQDAATKDTLFAFIQGFMYHYSLDRNAHPYIFYRSGFTTEENKDNGINYSFSHSRLETAIDVLERTEHHSKLSTKKLVSAPEEEVKAVSKMFAEVAKSMNYERIDENTYFDAWKDMKFILGFLYSRTGIKHALIKLFMKKSIACYIAHPTKIKDNDKYDYLNKRHSTWLFPACGAKSALSFLDMKNVAIKDTRTVDKILEIAAKNADFSGELDAFCQNIDHSGSKVNAPKIHYEYMWNK